MSYEIPYRYLNFPKDPLLPGWEENIKNLNSVFIHHDWDATFLKPEIKEIFLSKNLIPSRGNIWSWEPNSITKFYHTDQKETETTKCEFCAINWLISGYPGTTEWSYQALDNLDNKIDFVKKPKYSFYSIHNTQPQLWKGGEPDFSVPLNQPMIIRTNIPHRVNNLNNGTYRIAYSVRFKDNPTWEVVLEKLSDYIL